MIQSPAETLNTALGLLRNNLQKPVPERLWHAWHVTSPLYSRQPYFQGDIGTLISRRDNGDSEGLGNSHCVREMWELGLKSRPTHSQPLLFSLSSAVLSISRTECFHDMVRSRHLGRKGAWQCGHRQRTGVLAVLGICSVIRHGRHRLGATTIWELRELCIVEWLLCQEPELYPDAKTTDCMAHLCEVSREGKSLDTESRSAVPYGWEWELGQGVTTSGGQGYLGFGGNVLWLDCGDGGATR